MVSYLLDDIEGSQKASLILGSNPLIRKSPSLRLNPDSLWSKLISDT